jgi:hypothetical protein
MKKLDKILNEAKNTDNVTYSFWIDDLGNLLIDINDKEELEEYIKRNSEKLNGKYAAQLRKSDITRLSIPEIINRISWSYAVLSGTKETVELYDLKNKKSYEKLEKKKHETIVYTKLTIRTDLPLDPTKKIKNKILLRMIDSIKALYPSLQRVKVIGAKDNSMEVFL